MLTNYVPDPLAVGPQLLMQGSGATVSKVADSVIAPRSSSYRVVASGVSGSARLPAAYRAPVSAGQSWAGSALFRFDPDYVGVQSFALSLEFVNSAGSVVSQETTTVSIDVPPGFYETSEGSGLFYVGGATMSADRSYPATLFTPVTDDVYELTTAGPLPFPEPATVQVFGTAPEGAVSVNVAMTGSSFYATQLMLVQAAQAMMPKFFTGASGPFYAWSGAADASSSLYYQTAPELVPRDDRSPVERVELTFREVLPAAQYVNVWRVADGRTMQVRGGLRKYAVGGFAVVDYEAPFGVPITYRAEMFTDDTMTVSIGFTETASTQLDVTGTCIHQPLNPSSAVWPLALMGTADQVTRRTPGSLIYSEGSEVGSWVGGQRRGVEGVQFVMLTETLADADRFQAALGRYGETNVAVLCIRTPPPMRIPRTFFGTVAELVEVAVDVAHGGGAVQFEFTSDEVRPPAPGLVPALLRRDDIDAAYPTRAERAAAYLTRLDRDRDFTLAGLAG